MPALESWGGVAVGGDVATSICMGPIRAGGDREVIMSTPRKSAWTRPRYQTVRTQIRGFLGRFYADSIYFWKIGKMVAIFLRDPGKARMSC